jgi:hypothetical protein
MFHRTSTVRNLLVAAGAIFVFSLGVTAQSYAATTTTVGLTGGAPLLATGQQAVKDAGVTYAAWSAQQEDAGFGASQPLISGLGLRFHLRFSMTLPAFSAALYQTQDEAWMGGYSPTVTAAQVAAIHAIGGVAVTNQGWNPAHPPTLAQLRAYPGDILSVDAYPSPGYPNADIGPHVARMKAIANGRPVWATIQVCSRGNMASGVVPTAAREWKMAKAALNNGANGIFFFGGAYSQCFHTTHDRATGFNWSAWNHTILPTIKRIRAY